MCRRYSLLMIAAFLSIGLATARATTVTIVFQSAENSYGGAGTALYYGTLNGTSTSFICDDATHDIGSGSTWNANVWTLSQVVIAGNGAFAGSPYNTATGDAENNGNVAAMNVQQSYNAVAYLANLLLTGNDTSYANQIQYAIWEIMDDPQLHGFTGPGNNAFGPGEAVTDTGYWAYQGYLNDTYRNSQIVFYSPDGNKISAGPYQGDIAQEFIGLTAAEPSSVLLLALVLFAGLVVSSTAALRKKLS